MKTLLLSLSALAATSTSSLFAGYTLVQAPLPDDPMQVHIYRLDNGLTVYLTQNHEKPTFRSEVAVRAGSRHDPADATGLAHYLEHLLFKGNQDYGTSDWEAERPHIERIEELYEEHYAATDPEERRRIYAEINKESQLAAQYAIPSEYDTMIATLGGSGINAYTAPDRTVYLSELPANRLQQWAQIESSRFIDPVFRLFQPELETVYEEKNRSMDNKTSLLSEPLFALMYGEHPYGSQTALGSIEHLKSPSIKKIHEFFDAYYVANNMAVSLAGDFEIEDAIQIVDTHFSKLPSGEVPEFDRAMPPSIDEKKSVEVFYPGEENVVIGFDTVPAQHKDEAVLKLVDMVMDNAAAGLINLNLNQAQKVAQAGSYPYVRVDAGSQFFYGAPKQGQSLEEVEQLILEQIEKLKAGEFEDWILEAIVNDFKKNQKQALETNEGRLRLISTAFGEGRPWSDVVSMISQLEKLTKEDVVAAANKYLSGPYVVGYRRDGDYTPPKVDKPQFDAIEIDRSKRSEFAAALLSQEAAPIEPHFVEQGRDYQIVPLREGVRLLYVKNPVNDLFSLTKTLELGSQELRELGYAAGLMDKSGTSRLSPSELKRAWYQLGSEFSFSVDEHVTQIGLSGLDENFDKSLELFEEVLSDIVVEQEVLDRLIAISLKRREDSRKDPSAIFTALRNYARHGEDSPVLKRLTSDEIKALSVDDLTEAVYSLKGYKHDYLYVGQLPVGEVAEKLKALLPEDESFKDTPPVVLPEIAQPAANQVYYYDFESAQSQIRIEFSGGDFDVDERPMIDTFNEYFYGGMGGIVFQEMREARALAYSVWAYFISPKYKNGEGLVVGYIGTQADKTNEALSAYLELWNNMPRSEERFEVALASLENQYRSSKIGFRQILQSVKIWERLGLEGDPREKRFRTILEGDLEKLFGFYEAKILGKPRVISLLGPSSSIDEAKLGESGEVIEVEADTIFVD